MPNKVKTNILDHQELHFYCKEVDGFRNKSSFRWFVNLSNWSFN